MTNDMESLESFSECLQESKSTRDITDILAPLEHSNEKQPPTVLVEGAPGLGKTVLLKQLAFEWAQNKLLGKSQLVFLLLLQDPDVQAMTSVRDLVQYFYQGPIDTLKAFTDIISKTNGRNLTFLFDGYDKLPPCE